MKKILVLHGPNLNLLGTREPTVYGSQTLSEINADLEKLASQNNIALTHFQSNSEAELIHAIHDAKQNKVHFVIINPAAFTHTSIALRDAFAAVQIPFIEVHISNIHSREAFRQHSYLSDIAQGVICGLGGNGYTLALQAVIDKIKNREL